MLAATAALAGCGSATSAAHLNADRSVSTPSATSTTTANPTASHYPIVTPTSYPSCSGSAVGPTGLPLCGHLQHVIATTNHPNFDQNLLATCLPTGQISDGAMDYSLTIRYPNNISGLVPIDVREVEVWLEYDSNGNVADGIQSGPFDTSVSSPVTLNPGSSVTLHLSAPLDSSPGDEPMSCALGGVNTYGG